MYKICLSIHNYHSSLLSSFTRGNKEDTDTVGVPLVLVCPLPAIGVSLPLCAFDAFVDGISALLRIFSNLPSLPNKACNAST